MPSLMEIFTRVCSLNPPKIAEKSHKNVKTAMKTLASAYGTTPEQLAFTPELEANYRDQLRTYFAAHPKGHSTVRNTLNFLATLWKIWHQLDQSPPGPRPAPQVPGVRVTVKQMAEQSPYRHFGWLAQHPYRLPRDRWPADIVQRWEIYEQSRLHDLRAVTRQQQSHYFSAYASYHLLTPADRLAALPDEAKAMLHWTSYQGYLREILDLSCLTSWDELFTPERLNSFITWASWRVWRWHDYERHNQTPHRPSSWAESVARFVEELAKHTHHPNHPNLSRLCVKLDKPIPMHDKKGPLHRFDLAELEAVALSLINEARAMSVGYNVAYPGAKAAGRFQLGLILQLAWRNPMRARNWCEAKLEVNLRYENGHYRWYFLGDELKISQRGNQPNVFEPDVPVEVEGHLHEFLTRYRPKFPNAATDPHVFLLMRGTAMQSMHLRKQLREHVSRYTGKRLYTHLLRSLFSTYHLTHGMDINSVAYAMNDTPQSVLKAYNQLMADTHRPIVAAANERALVHGNGHLLTPPVIPGTPKTPRSPAVNPAQLTLIE